MLKIPTIFAREAGKSDFLVDFKTENLDWFWEGDGVATRKWDGTPVLVDKGRLYKRVVLRRTQENVDGFLPCGKRDPVTGGLVGWAPVTDAVGDIWFFDAPIPKTDGTYELCGPRINGNPERLPKQVFIFHGIHTLKGVPRTFAELKDYLRVSDIEGIVWHRGNGECCKIKKTDFGFKR